MAMTPIEQALRELARQPSPPQLAAIEAQVWHRVSAAEPAWSWRIPATAMVAAMLVGVMTGIQPGGRVAAAEMDALSVRPALLPSTLLVAN
jgi:hypothetical protein